MQDYEHFSGLTLLHYAICKLPPLLTNANLQWRSKGNHDDDDFDKYNLIDRDPRDIYDEKDEYTADQQSNRIDTNGDDMGLELIKVLLANGMDEPEIINHKCATDGTTAIHTACTQGNLAVVDLLLRCKNIDVNIRDFLGHTPLIAVCLCDNTDIPHQVAIVNKLIRFHGCDLFITTDQDETCLMVSLNCHNDAVVQCIGQYLNETREKSIKDRQEVEHFLNHKCNRGKTLIGNKYVEWTDDAKSLAQQNGKLDLYKQLFGGVMG